MEVASFRRSRPADRFRPAENPRHGSRRKRWQQWRQRQHTITRESGHGSEALALRLGLTSFELQRGHSMTTFPERRSVGGLVPTSSVYIGFLGHRAWSNSKTKNQRNWRCVQPAKYRRRRRHAGFRRREKIPDRCFDPHRVELVRMIATRRPKSRLRRKDRRNVENSTRNCYMSQARAIPRRRIRSIPLAGGAR